MRTIPVTPELISILKNSVEDTKRTLSEVEAYIDKCTGDSRAIIESQVERRRQLLAVALDIITRYK